MLTLQDLAKSFGALVAVDDVSLTIEEGETHSIIGPNGAGKTTLFNLITGTLSPTAGKILFKSEDITDLTDYERARKGIGRSFQITKCFDDLTVYDNILSGVQKISENTYAMHRRRDANERHAERVWEIIEMLELTEFADQDAANLPHGGKRKLEIGISLGIDPDLLLLDEPAAGLGHEEQQSIIDLVERLNEYCTVVLVEHNVDIVMTVSDRISVLDQGAIIMTDKPERVRTSERVKQAYLGTEI